LRPRVTALLPRLTNSVSSRAARRTSGTAGQFRPCSQYQPYRSRYTRWKTVAAPLRSRAFQSSVTVVSGPQISHGLSGSSVYRRTSGSIRPRTPAPAVRPGGRRFTVFVDTLVDTLQVVGITALTKLYRDLFGGEPS